MQTKTVTIAFVLSCFMALSACQSSPVQPETTDPQHASNAKQPLAINIDLSQTNSSNVTRSEPQPATATALPGFVDLSTHDVAQKRLQLALSLQQQGYIVLSNKLLNEISVDDLPEASWDDYYESLASTNQTLGFNSVVLDWLNKANAADTVGDLASRSRRLAIAVKAYQTNEQYLAAAQAAIELSKINQSTNMTNAERQTQYDQLWFLLTHISDADLSAIAAHEQDAIVSGWIDLVNTFKQQPSITVAQQAIQDWLSANTTHPANNILPIDLVNILNFTPRHVHKIAVVLPISGSLENIGQAIFDGIMANFYQQHSQCIAACQNTPTFTLFDSQKITDWQQQYQFFADKGFELMIGPLDKDNVARAWATERRTIPTLALNYLPDETIVSQQSDSSAFFQFGLSLEEEARQLAEQAYQNNAKRVLIVQINQAWAQRASQAFDDEWAKYGGELSGKVTIDGEASYAELVKQALHINESNNRRKDIQNTLGRNVSFEARRRQDIDFITLFSRPEAARQLIPTIAFHHGANIPIYASHHVYQGSTDTNRDIDLDKLTFTDIPWMLRKDSLNTQITAIWPQRETYNRLFALGSDAYALHNQIDSLQTLPVLQLPGSTGTLMHADGKIWGKLTWAQFNKGQPRIVNSPNELQ